MDAENRMLRALFIEDSPDDEILMLDALRGGGFSVSHERVDCPDRLENLVRENSWDVILCDHNMPGFDAPRALDIVRRHRDEVPFIIVSGSIPDDVAVAAMKTGAADFISKNNLSRLVPALERELKSAAQRKDLKQARNDIRRLANFDGFSGLPNREHFVAGLEALGDEKRQGVAVVHVELCRFRHAMKVLGADAGRQLLCAAAERLAPFSADGEVARVGEDCLAFMTEELHDAHQAERFCRSLIEAARQPVFVGEQELFLYCRLGISLGSGGAMLLDQAETATISIKDEGLGGYALYVREMDDWRHTQLELESALYRAVRNQEFELHYQPQLDSLSGDIIGVEALLRWNRPGYGMVSPARFIPLLEETGLIVPVGEWVLRSACHASREWQREGLAPIRMAVNLSAIQFRQPGLLELVKSALLDSDLAPADLELEITESVAIFNEEETIHTLRELGGMGVKLAIDDFGTGYSSLNSLKRFPFRKLKIDQTFVRDISRNANGETMIKAILEMAASLGLDVIAEGVETLEQAEFLQKCGCREMQGYYFSRPIAEPELRALLASSADVSRR